MKNIFFLKMTQILFLIISSLYISLFADNPIISHKYTADPSALVHNNRIYVYCSNDEDNNNGYQIYNYTLISSDDMVNWTDHGEVFKVKHISKWANMAYAPSCVKRDEKFYLYYPDGGSGIGVAVADKPEGPFTDPLGKALISKSMPNCNVPWLFDPCGFVDDEGQAYLTFGGGNTGAGTNLRIIKLNDNMVSVSGTAQTVNAPGSFEASYLHKYNNKYYFSYSTTSQKIDYLMGDKPMGDYIFKGTVLPNPPKDLGNNNHASIVEFNNKWYIFYHDRSVSNSVYKRSVNVDFITYNADGSMKQTTCTTNGVSQIKNLNPYDTVQAETIDKQKGIETGDCNEGGMMLTSLSEGDYTNVTGVDFGEQGATKFEIRAASASNGGSIELRLGSANGTLVGTCNITGTGSWTTWKTFSCDVSNCTGINNLYLVYKGLSEPYRLNWYRFSSSITNIKTVYNKILERTGKITQHKVSIQNKNDVSGTNSVHDLSGRTVIKQNQSKPIKKSRGVYIVK